MPPIKTFGTNESVPEKATSLYAGTLTYLGAAIDSSAVSEIVMTMVDGSGAIVNNREAVNVFNANGGELASGGAFTFQVTPADTTLPAGSRDFQVRHMTFTVTHSAGKVLQHQVTFFVRNLAGIS